MSQSEPMDGETHFAEHPQGHSGGILWSHSIAMDVKHREMACVDKLHRTIAGHTSHDDGRELPCESALAENAVGVFHQAVEREAGFGETAKRGMEMAHE